MSQSSDRKYDMRRVLSQMAAGHKQMPTIQKENVRIIEDEDDLGEEYSVQLNETSTVVPNTLRKQI